MKPLTFKLKVRPPCLVDAAALRPQPLAGLGREGVLRIMLPGWNQSFAVGDLFSVSGDDAGRVVLEEVDGSLIRVGAGLESGELTVAGDAGDYAGEAMLPIHHDEAADVVLFHQPGGFANRLVFVAPQRFRGHHFMDCCQMRVAALGHDTNRKVAVRHEAKDFASSTTGSKPILASRIFRAACSAVASGRMVCVTRVITSWIFMAHLSR